MAEQKEFFKITFQDMEVAKEFFENSKHYSEWLFLVSEYYQGNVLSSKVKIVQKYFKSYQKTINFIINSKIDGRKGFDKRVENQTNKNQTLNGYVKDTSSTIEPILDANNKTLTTNDKLLIINDQSITEIEEIPIEIIDSDFLFKKNAFVQFWNLYDKKASLKECEKKFLKLPKEVIEKILEVVPLYVKSTPEKEFRKHPGTWLNNECWNDEIINRNNPEKEKYIAGRQTQTTLVNTFNNLMKNAK